MSAWVGKESCVEENQIRGLLRRQGSQRREWARKRGEVVRLVDAYSSLGRSIL